MEFSSNGNQSFTSTGSSTFFVTNTKNESFIRVSEYLKSIDIKNNAFMLRLDNQSLIGVDPYDPNLTNDQKKDILIECMKNPWYFLREVLLISSVGGEAEHYQADRGNIAETWNTLKAYDTWSCKPRQTRLTLSTLSILIWKYLFEFRCSTINLNSRLLDDSELNLDKLTNCIDLLPDYVCGIRFRGRSSITHADNHNIINTVSAYNVSSSSKKIDDFTEKIMDASINYFDDAAFIKGINKIIESTRVAQEKSKIKKVRIFTSTRNRTSNIEKWVIYGSVIWNENMYDFTEAVLDKMIQCSRTGIMYIEYDWKGLSLSEKWLEQQRRLIDDEETYRSEILLEFGQNITNENIIK
jgi:hypothetical protein